jgi:hypothetical protein
MEDEMASFLWEEKKHELRSGDSSKHGVKNRHRCPEKDGAKEKGLWSRVQRAMYYWLCGTEEVGETRYYPLPTDDSSEREYWGEQEDNEFWEPTEQGRCKDPTKES